jgi:hypothetical protein
LPYVAIFENGQAVGGVNLSTETALRDLVAKVREKMGISK